MQTIPGSYEIDIPLWKVKSSLSHAFKIAKSPEWKYTLSWLYSSRGLEQFLRLRIPWIVYSAIDFINHRLPDNPVVFEYGSGGSTLYWIKKKGRVISIEHDPEWYTFLFNQVRNVPSVDYRLILPESTEDEMGDPSDPFIYRSKDKDFLNYSFEEFVKQIDEFPDESFDVVLIDGRARASCIYSSYQKVRIGGMLILDNANLNYYTEKTSSFLNSFVKHRFTGHVPIVYQTSTTDVFVRNLS